MKAKRLRTHPVLMSVSGGRKLNARNRSSQSAELPNEPRLIREGGSPTVLHKNKIQIGNSRYIHSQDSPRRALRDASRIPGRPRVPENLRKPNHA